MPVAKLAQKLQCERSRKVFDSFHTVTEYMQTCSDVRWHKTLANMETRSSKFSHSEIKKHYVALALIVACILGLSATFVEQRIGSQQKPGRQVNSPHCVHNAIGKQDRAISAAESNGQHHQVGDQEADDTRPAERLIYLWPGGKVFSTPYTTMGPSY